MWPAARQVPMKLSPDRAFVADIRAARLRLEDNRLSDRGFKR